MKKVVSFILVFVLAINICGFPAAAVEPRIMPLAFDFTDSIQLATGVEFPPGYANYDIHITGVYDAEAGQIISIDTKTCAYRGGVNVSVHDMVIDAWQQADSRGVVYYKLTGTLSFEWTSPISGMKYEKVFLESPVYSFRANDYT